MCKRRAFSISQKDSSAPLSTSSSVGISYTKPCEKFDDGLMHLTIKEYFSWHGICISILEGQANHATCVTAGSARALRCLSIGHATPVAEGNHLGGRHESRQDR